MEIVRVDLGVRSYEVMVGEGLIDRLGDLTSHLALGATCALISHEAIFELFGDRLLSTLKQRQVRVFPIFVPQGETSKSLEWAQKIYHVMMDCGLDRNSFVIALGGGVVGDLAGFIAGTYMRGIDFVQVPTTLLAQVDASVGGKTGVNLSSGKNLVGVFHQPRLVIADVNTLQRLPQDEFISGMAEVIKYGIIKDRELFEYLESHSDQILKRDLKALEWIVQRSCAVKAWVISQDERESGIRAILNYGHTVGHALETATHYLGYRHGQAISIGMVCAGWISQQKGFLSDVDFKRQVAILKRYGLPIFYKAPGYRKVYPYLWADKKKRQRTLTFILSKGIGEVMISRDVSEELMKEALKKIHR